MGKKITLWSGTMGDILREEEERQAIRERQQAKAKKAEPPPPPPDHAGPAVDALLGRPVDQDHRELSPQHQAAREIAGKPIQPTPRRATTAQERAAYDVLGIAHADPAPPPKTHQQRAAADLLGKPVVKDKPKGNAAAAVAALLGK